MAVDAVGNDRAVDVSVALHLCVEFIMAGMWLQRAILVFRIYR
jgi:hypothetical protein